MFAEHNRCISSTNEQQLAVVRTLEARERTLKEEIDRLVAAVTSGSGAPKALVSALEKRESELQELGKKIAQAVALVQPLLLPRPNAVAEYLTGTASIFTGDFTQDRKLLEQVVEQVLVYQSGALVVQFRKASLFERAQFATLVEPSSGDLAASRRKYESELQRARGEAARVLGREKTNTLAFDVVHDPDGNPAYVMFTPGVVKRTFGPDKYATSVTAPTSAANEIALASPAGVEPALAT